MEKKCSRLFCPMNYTEDVSECKCVDTCQYFSPLADDSGMEAVLDMAIKQFDLQETERKKLRILFNAYVSEYMKMTCYI